MKFHLKVRHDDGVFNITTHAGDAAGARQIVMAAERCPASAIREVRAVDEKGWEVHADGEKAGMPFTLDVPAADIAVDAEAPRNPYASDCGRKIPMRYRVRIGARWHRVYMVRFANAGTPYTIRDGIKTVVNLEAK